MRRQEVVLDKGGDGEDGKGVVVVVQSRAPNETLSKHSMGFPFSFVTNEIKFWFSCYQYSTLDQNVMCGCITADIFTVVPKHYESFKKQC